MSNPVSLQERVKEHAIKAVELDKNGQYESAIIYYLEASQALIDLKSMHGTSFNQNLQAKLNDYISRAEALKKHTSSGTKSQTQLDIESSLSMLRQALDKDQEANLKEAFELYTKAVQIYIKIPNKSNIETKSREIFKKLQANIQQAIQRAEEIKKLLGGGCRKNDDLERQQHEDVNDDFNLEQKLQNLKVLDSSDDEDFEKDAQSAGVVSESFEANHSVQHSRQFTEEEIAVLRHGSTINSRKYVPFFPQIDSKEKFLFPIPFSDKDGKLALSSSQLARFSHWSRPHETFDNPTLTMLVSAVSVKQTCISDCSFVASLTVCAQYERKFGKSLLSKIIYPQDKKCQPVYNPSGKYMISLNLNGCQRKILVDDYFPVDKNSNLLCSHTTNRGELWVSLLEKAYLKVMGGYDFPGSNSNIDLHALTNWIPERISIHGSHNNFDKDRDFQRLFERIHSGDCLVTLATGPLSKDQEERTGLVSTHAYAVLDIRMFKNKRLFQIKNPWSHLRWKGNYSEYDIKNWSHELQTALNYDPKMACNIDNGIFWIDYDSLIKFFDVFYVSWNPNLFQYTNLFHRKWSANEGPIKDRYNLGENPQYILRTKTGQNSPLKCTTWLLLTRHIVDKSDFAENKEYIALVVYKSSGKRIYYPMEPEPFKEGIRINSPHYLVKLVDEEPTTYTLVISQYEKYNSIYYTLRTYSTQPFRLDELTEPYNSKYSKRVTGNWTKATAGGCLNYHQTYKNNPLFQLTLANSSAENCLKIELKGPQEYSVGFDLMCVASNVTGNKHEFKMKSTGDYRKGYCVLAVEGVSGGTYTIRPSTYVPGQVGPFILEVESNREFLLTRD